MSNQDLYGALAEFKDPADLYHACEKVRDAGYRKWDAHTPFPVHGLDKAMGLKASKVPWITLAGGLTGATLGMTMEYWIAAVDYPLIISGKPLFSWPAFIPVMFELGVLFAAFGTVFGMLALNKLPQMYHPLFQSERFERVTDDKFFICIEATDPQFSSAEKVTDFLKEIGAVEVEMIKP